MAAPGGTAAVLDYAVTQILWDDKADDALRSVLARLTGAFDLRTALLFQPSSGTVLAVYPAEVSVQDLLGKIDGHPTVPAQRTVPLGQLEGSALVVYAQPIDGDSPCALALIGDPPDWDDEILYSARAVVALVAAKLSGQAGPLGRLRAAQEQNARLRELDEARNQFIAMVSHELRTPLTSIVSFSELIKGEAEGLTSEGLRFLDIIDRNADRLLRLTGDLLLLSRLEAGAIPLDHGEVSIPELVKEAANAASATAASQGIVIGVTAGAGPAIHGDYRRLHQVLDNLISNAVKFSHLHGHVQVSAACDGENWRIDVADSGIGIPPGEASQLFDRFVRASNARVAGLPGAGLGLSIVKAIVELHGGHIEVETAPDHGTTFSVFLPVSGPVSGP